MGLVAAALALLVAGCYSPSLRDCTLSCAATNECATGQTCTTTGWCAGAGAACAPSGGVIDAGNDAARGAPDASASPIDAAVPPIDAPPVDAGPVDDLLKVQISGAGQVVIDGIGTCGSSQQDVASGACMYQVVAGTPIVAHAVNGAQDFDKWMDAICKLQGATCSFTLVAPTLIEVHFK